MVIPSRSLKCKELPCIDVNSDAYYIPNITLDPTKVRIFMIAEAPPTEPRNSFYAKGSPFFLETTLKAFNDAGCEVQSMQDVIDLGVYVTTVIKCGKVGYSISTATVKACTDVVLEKEIALFSNVQCFLLMGDMAIKGFNHFTKNTMGKRVIPSGSTYKIRKNVYYFDDMRIFPSYLMTGKSYLIEKSKQKMIAEDIRKAIKIVNQT